jgi:hypothetical protein
MNASAIAAHLNGKKTGTNSWQAHCPAHDDKQASLSITQEGDKVLVHCHAGCPQTAVIDRLRLANKWPAKRKAASRVEPEEGEPEQKPHVVATYVYEDENGKPRYRVVRLSNKAFPQERAVGDGFYGGAGCMDGVTRLPFHLPELLDALDANANHVVFVAEGEKDVLNLEKMGLVATTNSGGGGKGKWQPEISRWLKGADVVLLPDNDQTGRQHVEDVAAKLHGTAKRIRILALPGLAEHGDVTDWLDAGGTAKELRRLAKAAPEWEPAAPRDDRGPTPLGYSKDGRFILLDIHRRLPIAVNSNQITKASELVALATSDYWAERFPSEGGRFSAFEAGEYLMQECRKAGPFELSDLRRRGIWREGNQLVVNLGGPVPAPRYVCFKPITIDGEAKFDTKRLLKLVQKFKWRYPRDAYLLLGWLAIAPICGVLNWRPHIWVHGPAETGKSTLHTLLKCCCSPLALSADGGSSEAGIRQTLGLDSLPVLIDEFESDQATIKGILKLARTASSSDDPLLRGTPEGRAQAFAARSTFAFFAVNPLGMSVADESRIVMLELMKHSQDSKIAKLIADETAYFRGQQGTWCSMMISRAELVPEAIERFERSVGVGDRRHRQNMATLLGGAFVALFGDVPDKDDIEEWSDYFEVIIARHSEEHERDEGQECLDHFFAHTVRSQDWGEYPLRHWLAVAITQEGIGLAEARRIVATFDMKIRWPDDGEPGGVYLKNKAPAIEKAFTGSRWAGGGWERGLRKLAGVEAGGQIKFGRDNARSTRIPLEYVPPAIDPMKLDDC